MENPWADLPTIAPFVAPQDLRVSGTMLVGDSGIHTEILPHPYCGVPDEARVLLLTLNPGYSPRDNLDEKAISGYATEVRAQPTFSSRVPFMFLDPEIAVASGPRWWSQRLKSLIVAVGWEAVSNHLMEVEYWPYHSEKWRRRGEVLPTQRWAFQLVRDALAAHKIIVIMRGARYWRAAVPQLLKTPVAVNPRNGTVSQRNLGNPTWAAVVDSLGG